MVFQCDILFKLFETNLSRYSDLTHLHKFIYYENKQIILIFKVFLKFTLFEIHFV